MKQCHLQQHGWTQRLSYEVKYFKSETERQIPYDITYMWNLKYDTNELIYRQTQKTKLWLPKGKTVGAGGINEEFGINIHKTIYKIDRQQGPTVQHRELYSISCDKP